MVDVLLARRRSMHPAVRLAARALALGRVGLGVAMVAAPGAATRRWLGPTREDDPAREVAVRGLGARDLVLGIGTLVAFRSGGEVRQAARWIEAGIVADLTDAAATTVAEGLDASKTMPTSLALGAAITGAIIRTQLR